METVDLGTIPDGGHFRHNGFYGTVVSQNAGSVTVQYHKKPKWEEVATLSKGSPVEPIDELPVIPTRQGGAPQRRVQCPKCHRMKGGWRARIETMGCSWCDPNERNPEAN